MSKGIVVDLDKWLTYVSSVLIFVMCCVEYRKPVWGFLAMLTLVNIYKTGSYLDSPEFEKECGGAL